MPRAPAGPIQISPGQAGRLIVFLPYTQARVAKIKNVVGCRRDPKERCWTAPHTDEALARLFAILGGRGVRSPADALLQGLSLSQL